MWAIGRERAWAEGREFRNKDLPRKIFMTSGKIRKNVLLDLLDLFLETPVGA